MLQVQMLWIISIALHVYFYSLVLDLDFLLLINAIVFCTLILTHLPKFIAPHSSLSSAIGHMFRYWNKAELREKHSWSFTRVTLLPQMDKYGSDWS